VAAWPRDPDGLERVVLGVEHHFEVDAWFHDTDVFTRGEALARARLAETGWARAGLFAHVVWELCLDGALLARSPGTAAESPRAEPTQTLGKTADLSPLATRLLEARFPHVPRAVRSAQAARLERLLSRVVELAAGYSEARGLYARLEGMRHGLGLPPTDAPTMERVVLALDELLTLARPDVEELQATWRGRGSRDG
jgi:hypothetical protein